MTDNGSAPDEDALSIADWLRILLSGRPHQVIGDDPSNPYLLRWFLVPRNPIVNVYRHRFCQSDPSVPHDHPWHFASIVLHGHYREISEHRTVVRRPGSVAFRRASSRHRVELLGHPVTTVIITGPRCRRWGFWCPRPAGAPAFVPWQQFGSGGCGEYPRRQAPRSGDDGHGRPPATRTTREPSDEETTHVNTSCLLHAPSPGFHASRPGAQGEARTATARPSSFEVQGIASVAPDDSDETHHPPRARGWDRHYDALVNYVADKGHSWPPRNFVSDDGLRLGTWVIAQRALYRAGRLAPERIERLERLPGWEWSAHRARWDDNYLALKCYVDVTGHARPPEIYESADGRRLGKWVKTQRTLYRAGLLPPERVERLERLTGWEWSARHASWNDNYSALVRFVDATGHARPAVTFVGADGLRLGAWVSQQRHKYRNGNLPPNLVQRLERLPGWAWRVDNQAEYDAAWESAFSALEQFVAAFGHAQPPSKWRGDGIRLGVWVYRQRRAYCDGRLSPQRARRLEALPEWTWVGRRGKRPNDSPLNMKCAAKQGIQGPPPRR